MLPSNPNQPPNGNGPPGPPVNAYKDLLRLLKDRVVPINSPNGPQRACNVSNFLFQTTDHRVLPQQQSHDFLPPPPYPGPPLPIPNYGYTHFERAPLQIPPPLQTPPPEVLPRSPFPHFPLPSQWPQGPPFPHLSQQRPQQREPINGQPESYGGPPHAVPNTLYWNNHNPLIASVLPTSLSNDRGPPVIRPSNSAPAASVQRPSNETSSWEEPGSSDCSATQTSHRQKNGNKLDLFLSGLKEMLSKMDRKVETTPGNNPALVQQAGSCMDTHSDGDDAGDDAATENATNKPNSENVLVEKEEIMEVNEDCMLLEVDLSQKIFTLVKPLHDTVIDLVEDSDDDNGCQVVKVERQESSTTQCPFDDDNVNDSLPLENTVPEEDNALVMSSVPVSLSDFRRDDGQVMDGPPGGTSPLVNPPENEKAPPNILKIVSGLGDILQSLSSAAPKTNEADSLATVKVESVEGCSSSFNQFPCIHSDKIVISDSDSDNEEALIEEDELDKGKEQCSHNEKWCARRDVVDVQLEMVSLNEETSFSSSSKNDQRATTISTPTDIADKNCHGDASPNSLKEGVKKRGRPRKTRPKFDESLAGSTPSAKTVDGELDKGKELCSHNEKWCARQDVVDVQLEMVSLNEETSFSSSSKNDQRATTISTPIEIADKNCHGDVSPNSLKEGVKKRGRPRKTRPKFDESLAGSMPSAKTVDGELDKGKELCSHNEKWCARRGVVDVQLEMVSLNEETSFSSSSKNDQRATTPSTPTEIADKNCHEDVSPNSLKEGVKKRGRPRKTKPKLDEFLAGSTPSAKTVVSVPTATVNGSCGQIVKDSALDDITDIDNVRGRGGKHGFPKETTQQIVKSLKVTSEPILDKSSICKMVEGTVNDPISTAVNVTQADTNNTDDSLDKSPSNELVRKECHMTTMPDVQSDLHKETVQTVHKYSTPGHGPSSSSALMESSRSESEDSDDSDTSSNQSVVSNSSWEDDAHVEYKCKVCSQSFGRKSHFKKHMKTHRGGSAEKVEKKITCKGCRKKFSNKTGLQAHLLQRRYCFYDCTRTHWKPKTSSTKSCRMCSKAFDRLKHLKKHAYRHLTCRLEFINLVLDKINPQLKADKINPHLKDDKIKPHLKDLDGSTKHDVKFKSKSKNENVISDHKVPEARQISKGHQGSATELIGAPSATPSNAVVPNKAKHERSEKYLCKSCEQDFQTPLLFRDHLNVKDSCKLFYLQPDSTSPVSLNYCPSCCIFMSCQFRLLSHQCPGKTAVTNKCPSCSRLFSTSFGLRQHLNCSTCSSLEKTKKNTKTAWKKVAENAIGNQGSVPLSPPSQVVKSAGTERHECLLCPKIFLQVQGLLEHSYSHPEDDRFQCNDCSMVFSRYNSLVSHTIWHRRKQELVNDKEDDSSGSSRKKKTVAELSAGSVTKVYCCPKCPIKYKRKADLDVHWLKHKFPKSMTKKTKKSLQITQTKTNISSAGSNDTLFSCSSCGQQFPTLNSRNDHLETCVRCPGKTTPGEDGPSHPMVTDDRGCGKASMKCQSNLFKCILCPRFLLKASFKSHLKTHIKRYSRIIKQESTMPLITPCKVACIICKKILSCRRVLLTHLTRHTPEEIMKKTQKGNHPSGRAGVLTQMNVKGPKEEAISPQQSSPVRKGMIAKKIAKQTYSFSCKQCDKKFLNIPSFKFHLKVAHKHLKSDGWSSYLTYLSNSPSHSIVNPSNRPPYVSCEICQKVVQKYSLSRHMQSIHGLSPELFSLRQNRKSANKLSDPNGVKKELNPGVIKNVIHETDGVGISVISTKVSSIADVQIHPRIEVDNGGMDITSCQNVSGKQRVTEWFHRECLVCGEPLESKVQSWKHQFQHVTPCSVVASKLEHVLTEVPKDFENLATW